MKSNPLCNLSALANYFFILVIFLFLKGGWDHIQYFDAGYYAALSQSFHGGHHHWSFTHFPITHRGYFFPFVLNVFNHFVTIGASALLIHVLCLFILSFFVAPHFSTTLFSRPFSKIQALLFSIIFFYFWGGYFYYALTDIIAITLLLAAAVLIQRKKYWSLLIGGMAIAMAFNIRPIYELNLILFVGYLIWHTIRKNIHFYGLMLFLGGMILILLPQVIINHHNHNSYSPLVITNSYLQTANNASIYNMQLDMGLRVQKYETYVGNLEKFPSSRIAYSTGADFYNQYRQSTEQTNLGAYIKFAISNPLQITQIYLTHLFNGLDIKVNKPYITKIKSLQFIHLISILNYIVLIFGVMALVLNWRNKAEYQGQQADKVFFYANCLLPVLLVIPTTVELRFFIPLFILLYLSFLQCFYTFKTLSKKNLCGLLLIAGLLFAAACYTSQQMSSHIISDPDYTSQLLTIS